MGSARAWEDVSSKVIDSVQIKDHMLDLMTQVGVEYKVFEHKPILSYEDAAEVQKEVGYVGTEGKSLVLKVDDKCIVYVTIQGKKVNFQAIKDELGVNKVRLATAEELQEYFGAQPGCAYPFGFNEEYSIYVDPIVYMQNWLVFSPCLPTFTIQAKGEDLKKVFDLLPNKVIETEKFNA